MPPLLMEPHTQANAHINTQRCEHTQRLVIIADGEVEGGEIYLQELNVKMRPCAGTGSTLR